MGLTVDKIQSSAGTDLYDKGYPKRPGQIIEYLTTVCDGSALKGYNEFTTDVCEKIQVNTYTYETIYGSAVSYTPPPGTSRVVYRFQFSRYSVTTHDITHYRFYVDQNEVVYARHSRSAQYPEERSTFEWTINIGGTTNFNTGRVDSWTGSKTMNLKWRTYGGSNYQQLHSTRYWDATSGSYAASFNIPTLTIIAVA
jgi:hypothetical protein